MEVEWIGEKRAIVLRIPVMDKEAIANEPEAVGEHERVREKKKEADPEQRRGGNESFVRARIHFLTCANRELVPRPVPKRQTGAHHAMVRRRELARVAVGPRSQPQANPW